MKEINLILDGNAIDNSGNLNNGVVNNANYGYTYKIGIIKQWKTIKNIVKILNKQDRPLEFVRLLKLAKFFRG